jgi:hypothetical protein
MTYERFVELEKERDATFDVTLGRISGNLVAVESFVELYQRIFSFFRSLTDKQYVERCLENSATYFEALERMKFLDFSLCSLLDEIRHGLTRVELAVAEDHPARPEGPIEPELERLVAPMSYIGGDVSSRDA